MPGSRGGLKGFLNLHNKITNNMPPLTPPPQNQINIFQTPIYWIHTCMISMPLLKHNLLIRLRQGGLLKFLYLLKHNY